MNEPENSDQISTTHRNIDIQQKDGQLQLVFSNQPQAIQSAINIQAPQKLVMTNLQYLMGILQFISPPQKILLLGVGGGSLVHFFRHFFPQSHITGVDYDQQLIQFAQTKMQLPEAGQQLQYVFADARQYIQQCQQHYDLIVVDIFAGSQSPEWTRDKAFIQQLKNCLSNQGAIACNMLISSDQSFKKFYSLLRELFNRQTLCLESPEYENILLYALNFSVESRTMMQNLQLATELNDRYQLPFTEILQVIYNINPVDSGII